MDRILLVESDIGACSAISRSLAALGYGIDIAYDASEARKLSERSRYRIGLIGERLSDGDGVALFRLYCRCGFVVHWRGGLLM